MTTSNPQNEIILYQPNTETEIEVRLENETVWLNRQQMAQLFDRDIKTIGKHIGNALAEELSGFPTVANFATVQTEGFENPVVAKFATTQMEGNRAVLRHVEYYSLDVILSPSKTNQQTSTFSKSHG